MRRPVSRREFLKLIGLGAAAAAGLRAASGRGLDSLSASAGSARSLATWHRAGSHGGGVRLQIAGDEILEVAPNPGHPAAAMRSDCFHAAAGLDDPHRLWGPLRRLGGRFEPLGWTAAGQQLAALLQQHHPDQIAFVLGSAADHLSDLVQLMAAALGGAGVLRFDAHSLLDGRLTLQDAAQQLFGLPRLPYFDTGQSNLVFWFNIDGDEPWLGNFWRGMGRQKQAHSEWVYFSPLPNPLSLLMDPDDWVMIRPGSEAAVARGLAQAVSRIHSDGSFDDLEVASQASGVSADRLHSLALRFARAGSALAVPGSLALSQSNGSEAARAVLALNALGSRLGAPGGVFLPLDPPLYPQLLHHTSTLAEAAALIERIHAGQIKAVLVHGVDLLAELPAALDVKGALQKLDHLVSFSSMPDETTLLADLLLPDHLPFESWGYEQVLSGIDRPLVAAIHPAVRPRANTRPTADVLLQAVHRLGQDFAARLPYRDGLSFIQSAVESLPWQSGQDGWKRWQEQGGWWSPERLLLPAVCVLPAEKVLGPDGAGVALATGGLRVLWSKAQRYYAPDGLSMLHVHPQVLAGLGLEDGDRARVSTAYGALDVRLRAEDGLWPDTLSLHACDTLDRPFSWPAVMGLFGAKENVSGDWDSFSTQARLEKF